MTKTHCDNCDVVIEIPSDVVHQNLRAVLRSGMAVSVETIILHPVTQRRLELCAPCQRAIINTATQPALKS